MSIGQLAETVGLPREAVYKSARARAGKTQSRMREMLEIINRVSNWAGGQGRRWPGIGRSLTGKRMREI